MFEMRKPWRLFQERSLALGLGILTEVLKLEKDRLYVSFFETKKRMCL
jgi:alanyl-tRNA synthetase